MFIPRFRLFMLLTAILVFFAADGSAQYFGRNKVHYDTFKFKVLHTAHFDVYYYDEEDRVINEAARMAERWYAREAAVLGDTIKSRQPLVLYGSHPQFEQTNVIQEDLGQGTGGVTEPVLRRMVLPFAASFQETDHVIGHELVHAFQFDITGERQRGGAYGMPGAARLPLWFVEGMAEYLSLGYIDPNTAMWLRDATKRNKLPDLKDLNSSEYFPYRYGQALLAYIGGRWGDRTMGDLLIRASIRGSMEPALDSVLAIKSDSLVKDWHRSLHALYDTLAKTTSDPIRYGPRLISREKRDVGTLNVAPALSPDGKNIVFFSERDLFSINVYLANAETGEITHTILHTERDPHFQSLEFINSAGAWSPDGKTFVFSAVDKGRPFLSFLDVDSRQVEQEHRFDELGEIYSPSWSPDGKRIVFSAIVGGITDLYVYDIANGQLERLTDDNYADLQPAWSPDGKEIAFVTDRFTTQMSDLKYGTYEIALISPDTKKIERLKGIGLTRNFNPQWAPDGRSLYLLADPKGITNIYRLNLADSSVAQITNLYTGVSGITSLSPALSVAEKTGRLVYSVFEDNGYSIYRADSTQILAGIPFTGTRSDTAAILPPITRHNELVTGLILNPHRGLPPDTAFEVTDYRRTLRLQGVAQPTAGIGFDQFGAYGGGGVALLWGDMLGDHYLSTALQIQSGGGFTDVAGLVGYLNTAQRLNWGGAIQQMPYTYTAFNAGVITENGQNVYAEDLYIIRQIDRDAMGILSYPFSQILRVDLTLGYRNIIFRQQINRTTYDLNTGIPLTNQTIDLPHESALNLGMGSLALVYDNSFFGATSPLLGTRYHLEVAPTIGSLQWTDVIGDYRTYYMPLRPISLAGRILHYGRYGRSGEDPRISPLFIGYPGLVRGYDAGTIDGSTIPGDTAGGDPYARILGSKMVVANTELRFPLFGIFGLGRGFYGWLPIEAAIFYDTGVAWWRGTKPSFLGGSVKPVSSTGAALRMNFFGFAVVELDYVHPFNHPNGKKWLWQFNLMEGF